MAKRKPAKKAAKKSSTGASRRAGKPSAAPSAEKSRGRAHQVRVLVGTRKGAFVFTSDAGRKNWKIEGPFLPGQAIYHLIADERERGALFAAANNGWFGSDIHRSYDGGKTWKATTGGLRFAEDSGLSTKAIWHIRPGRDDERGVVWAGVDPGGLFKSEDGGETWTENLGLNRHETRARWNPGAGGMCTHTILLDPGNHKRMYVGISAAGVFRSDDGGETWRPRNKNTRADFAPDKFPELGQCVHKIVMAPGKPSRLFQQNHCGMYRSEDAGDDWKDISGGLPSRFGFPIAVHPREAETIWVIPMVGAEMRAFPNGEAAVYHSTNGGRKWRKQTQGLPSRNAHMLVLREAFAADQGDPAGLYFGTETGQLFGSSNEGKDWQLLADFLPPILSVETSS
jgi:photosystem II stability/assembly factor-like uncharacterized protein